MENGFIIQSSGEHLAPPPEKWFEFKSLDGRIVLKLLLRRYNHVEVAALERAWLRPTVAGFLGSGRFASHDRGKLVETLADKVLVDAKGIGTADGRPAVMTDDLKRLVLTQLGDVCDFVHATLYEEDAFRKNAQGAPASSTAGSAPAISESNTSASA